MIYVLAALGILIVAFIWWRYTSVARGARQRDEKLLSVLDPIAEKLSKDEIPSVEEIAKLCREPQYRPMSTMRTSSFFRRTPYLSRLRGRAYSLTG